MMRSAQRNPLLGSWFHAGHLTRTDGLKGPLRVILSGLSFGALGMGTAARHFERMVPDRQHSVRYDTGNLYLWQPFSVS